MLNTYPFGLSSKLNVQSNVSSLVRPSVRHVARINLSAKSFVRRVQISRAAVSESQPAETVVSAPTTYELEVSSGQGPAEFLAEETKAAEAVKVSADALDIADAVAVIRKAVKDYSVSISDIFSALRLIGKAKPKGIDFHALVDGPGSTLRRWRLVYIAGGKDLVAANKGQPGGKGIYWGFVPSAFAISSDGSIENGLYLGHVASFKLFGKHVVKGNKMGWDFNKVVVKLGPWKIPIQLKQDIPESVFERIQRSPGLYVFVYADDEVMVVRGKGGGLALFGRADPVWELEAGVV